MNANNSFYVCEEYSLLIYETKDHAESAYKLEDYLASGLKSINSATAVALYLSKKFQTKITVAGLKEPIFVIEKLENYWNVIVGEKIGWIATHESLQLKLLVSE